MTDTKQSRVIPQWRRFEQRFTSSAAYARPFQDVQLTARFTSPSGRKILVEGFWDGGDTWAVRFAPAETGVWTYTTSCSNGSDSGLNGQTGSFTCGQPEGTTCFEQHGPLQLSADRRYLVHADGTPFFWLADTCWNGPLRSTPDEWEHYLSVRTRQQFTAVQWVATQWLAAPDGDIDGQLPYSGSEQIDVNPAFFQRLDHKIERMNAVGLLSVPVMLWAATWSSPEINATNPGFALPEDQAIKLARYMLARWSAYFTVWLLPGDGHYDGEVAERWKHIGRAVFGDTPHAPVGLHPGGLHWPYAAFYGETWLDMIGYQSGHSDSERTFSWLVSGPPAADWHQSPPRPFINLEPCYENHVGGPDDFRHDDLAVRRALYWSLLVAPTAGVTYGGHGVWGWDDGSAPSVNHPNTGLPQPWQKALLLPAAEQICHARALFESIEWRQLRPAPELLAAQPGDSNPRSYTAAARSSAGDAVVIYIPESGCVEVDMTSLSDDLSAVWFDPRSGQRQSALLNGRSNPRRFEAPAPGDWILLLARTVSLPAKPHSGVTS